MTFQHVLAESVTMVIEEGVLLHIRMVIVLKDQELVLARGKLVEVFAVLAVDHVIRCALRDGMILVMVGNNHELWHQTNKK